MLLVASGLLLGVGSSHSPAGAACMDPTVTVSPRTAGPGAEVLITGKGWKHGCNDTVDCPQGGPCSVDGDAPPRTGISLRFRQGKNTDVLGEVDAGPDSRFAHMAVIPLWATAGAATVSADSVATGFLVASGLGAGAAPVALDATGGGSAAAAGPVGEPLAKTGAETSAALGMALMAVWAAARVGRRAARPR